MLLKKRLRAARGLRLVILTARLAKRSRRQSVQLAALRKLLPVMCATSVIRALWSRKPCPPIKALT